MRWKRVAEEPVTYAVIFETGDELASGLKEFAKEQKLKDSSCKAIGACEYVKLGYPTYRDDAAMNGAPGTSLIAGGRFRE